jgi:hypothetical protein
MFGLISWAMTQILKISAVKVGTAIGSTYVELRDALDQMDAEKEIITVAEAIVEGKLDEKSAFTELQNKYKPEVLAAACEVCMDKYAEKYINSLV